MESETLTVKELTQRLAGVGARLGITQKKISDRIQHWTKVGILKTADGRVRSGTGAHRSYSHDALYRVAILLWLSNYNFQVLDLEDAMSFINLKMGFRPDGSTRDQRLVNENHMPDLFQRAIKGEKVFLVFRSIHRGQSTGGMVGVMKKGNEWDDSEWEGGIILHLDRLFKYL